METPSSATSTIRSLFWQRQTAASDLRGLQKEGRIWAISRTPGGEWRPTGQPAEVRGHDFKDKKLGKAVPYGIYDLANNEGWVSVGVDHDTGRSLRWRASVPVGGSGWAASVSHKLQRLLITADGGGSNGIRCRLWKVSLQKLANGLGLPVSVCHFPPGTSKWNKIEHRLFCQITQNWRGRPLLNREVIAELIRHTRTATGLQVEAELDTALYPLGKKISDEELAQVHLKPALMHGEWNYTISPER